MQPHNAKRDDTTKAHRTPRNLLEYVLDQSPNEDFFPLLAKHHENLKAPLSCNANSPEIKSAIFIVELNKFSTDLIKAAKICAQIESEVHNHHKNLENSRGALQAYDSKDLADAISSFYIDARNYDEHFHSRHWRAKINGKLVLPPLFLFANPFRHNSSLFNEENICNLVATFKIHNDFFRNYLNVLYGDGKDGEILIGKSFEAVSSEYSRIKCVVTDLLKIIPGTAPNKIIASIEQKRGLLEKIIEKYPATLYGAIKIILHHFENSAKPSLKPASKRL